MPGQPPRRRVYCPHCLAGKGQVLSQLVLVQEPGRSSGYGRPFWRYVCQLCGHEELHDREIG